MTGASHSNDAVATAGRENPANRGLSWRGWAVAIFWAVFAVILLAIVACGTLFVLKALEIRSYDARLMAVRIGDDSAKPIALLGEPHWVKQRPKLFRGKPTTFGFEGDQATTQRQFVYFVHTPYLPLIYVFDLDQDGVVVAKFRLD